MVLIRRYAAYFLFSFSSFCKALGKLIITKEKSIVVDILSLPGWFILDECIIRQVSLDKDTKLKVGFGWKYWSMPDEWCDEMKRLKQQSKGG